ALVALGEPAALQALADFGSAPSRARRQRAWLVREAGAAACIAGAIANLADADPVVRATLVEFLGPIELLQHALEARVEALRQRSLSDGQTSVRFASLAALAEIGEPAAIERLDRL